MGADPWAGLDYKFSGMTDDPRWRNDPVMRPHQRRLRAYLELAAMEANQGYPEEEGRRRQYGDPSLLIDQALSNLLGDPVTLSVPDEKWEPVLTDWWERETMDLKMLTAERDAIGLGDAVYVLGWSTEKARPTVSVLDPGLYMPILDEESIGGDEFPRTVHLVWEYEKDDGKYRRQVTYELLDSEVPIRYPWGTSNQWCARTDQTWRTDRPYRRSTATIAEDRVNLGIDFIPIVHIPNTPTGEHHFGKALLTSVAQILDDLSAAHTDSRKAAETTGAPIIGITGEGGAAFQSRKVKATPGMVVPLGHSGSISTVNTAPNLAEMRAYTTALEERLAKNSRIPQIALGGDVTAGESGRTVRLRYGPLEALVRMLRAVRVPKYRLLLKFVSRLYQAGGMNLADMSAPASVVFGRFLPQDIGETVAWVTQARAGQVISAQTAIDALAQAGVSVSEDEREMVQSTDFAGAIQLADATGSVVRAEQYLSGAKMAPDRE